MQKSTNVTSSPRYFIAANGYQGFRSYFSNVFKAQDFERIFILKGGPGTGKSSFLRALEKMALEASMKCECFLCSSDPESYDGVIIDCSGKRFAALDGTAPHLYDTEVPGAVDEIVNLGASWDESRLTQSRGLIEGLIKKKKAAYAEGYRGLHMAGEAKAISDELQIGFIRDKLLKNRIKELAESLLESEERGNEEVRLTSSFGRLGYMRLENNTKEAERIIRVRDLGLVTELFMDGLLAEIRKRELGFTRFPSVFADGSTDALFLRSTRTLIVRSEDGQADVDPEELIIAGYNSEAHSSAMKLYEELLLKAKQSFATASDLHFELEKIYIGAMSFKKNAPLLEKCVEKIKKASK